MKSILAIACVATIHVSAFAACTDNFAYGRAPTVSEQKFAPTHLLCFASYAVLESGRTRTGVWSAEQLTRATVQNARGLPRDNEFHAEESIAPSDRAELTDYTRNGIYDRGHLTPSGDEGDEQTQSSTFTLANAVPQSKSNNRRVWEHLEYATRLLASREGAVFVVTGPGFTSAEPHFLRGRVRIPDLMWKAIYIPRVGAAAYLTRNDAGQDFAIVSIAEVTRLAGVDPFPPLPRSMKLTAIDLPQPRAHRNEDADRQVDELALLERGAIDEDQIADDRTAGSSSWHVRRR